MIKEVIKKVLCLAIMLIGITSICSCSKTESKVIDETKPQNQRLSEVLYEKNNYTVQDTDAGFLAVSSNGTRIAQDYDGENLTKISFDYSEKQNSAIKLSSKLNSSFDSTTNLIINEYEYGDSSELTRINNNGKIFEFAYDTNSNFLYGTINGQKRYQNYFDKNNNLIKTIYSSGDIKEYTYDESKLKTISINGKLQYSFDYNGVIVIEKNHLTGEVTTYNLNEEENILSFFVSDKGISGEFEYDENNAKLISSKYTYGNDNFEANYTNHTTKFKNYQYTNKIDELDRNIGYTIGKENFKFTYKTNDVFDVSPIKFDYMNESMEFIYDDMGYLIGINKNGNQYASYGYDKFGQLTEEYYFESNHKIVYSYDKHGNILVKEDSKLGKSIYAYDQDDKMIKCNDSNLTYDLNGNIKTFNDSFLSWSGKQLVSYKNNLKNIQYSYNSNGIRTSKTVNGQTTNYQLVNNNVIFEYDNTNYIYYLYDENSNIIGFYYNGKTYFYIKNQTNDIIGIVDENNKQIVSYTYDAFGNILSTIDESNNCIGSINPYRYKSYRYDEETNLYYLNSRYYSPVLGRFISEDDIKSVNNEAEPVPYVNLYSYAQNNPLKYYDPNGDSVIVIAGLAISTKALILLGAAVVVSIVIASQADAIARELDQAFDDFVNLVKSLVGSLPSLWDIWTKSSKPEIHHIVAKAAAAAAPARSTCSRYGINVYSDPNNLVPIKSRFHRKLHKKTYYAAVNAIVVPCRSKTQVYTAMNGIRIFLLVLNVIA